MSLCTCGLAYIPRAMRIFNDVECGQMLSTVCVCVCVCVCVFVGVSRSVVSDSL